MARILYENFLSDSDEYSACEEYWQQLIAGIASALDQNSEWERWIPRDRPDGSPVDRDGNPIYDSRSVRQGKGIRIIQHICSGPQVELAAWIKSYEEEFVELPSKELVINLCLSEESANLAEALLSTWMSQDTDVESMRNCINATVPQ